MNNARAICRKPAGVLLSYQRRWNRVSVPQTLSTKANPFNRRYGRWFLRLPRPSPSRQRIPSPRGVKREAISGAPDANTAADRTGSLPLLIRGRLERRYGATPEAICPQPECGLVFRRLAHSGTVLPDGRGAGQPQFERPKRSRQGCFPSLRSSGRPMAGNAGPSGLKATGWLRESRPRKAGTEPLFSGLSRSMPCSLRDSPREQAMRELELWELSDSKREKYLRALDYDEMIAAKKAHHVYLIQAGKDGPIKIGKARSIRKRMDTLQTANPSRLREIFRFPCFSERQAYALERHLQNKMRRHLIRGEWFRPQCLNEIGKQVRYFFSKRALRRWKRAQMKGPIA